jgi:hypothetical protein
MSRTRKLPRSRPSGRFIVPNDYESGLKIPFAQSEAGQDRFVVIETDFKNHVLEIER